MDETTFVAWLATISRLDAAQREQAFKALALAEAADLTDLPSDMPAAESASAEPLSAKIGRERLDSFGCPHCGLRNVRPWGKTGGKPRYRCTDCRKTFNPLTGTPLSGLHYQDRWQEQQAQVMLDGVTLQPPATRCKVDYTTAFRWRHRFLAALNLDKPQRVSGIVEADETFVLESFKGRRGILGRPARKRGGKAAKRGLSTEQIPVLIARDRSGATIDAVLPRLDAESMAAALGHVVSRGAHFCCDGGAGMRLEAAPLRRAKHAFA